jgi:hypothetical protein
MAKYLHFKHRNINNIQLRTRIALNPRHSQKPVRMGCKGQCPLPGLLRAEPLTEIVKSRALNWGVGQRPTGVQGWNPCKMKGKTSYET